MIFFWALRYNEKRGHWPLLKKSKKTIEQEERDRASSSEREFSSEVKANTPAPIVRELSDSSSREGKTISDSA